MNQSHPTAFLQSFSDKIYDIEVVKFVWIPSNINHVSLKLEEIVRSVSPTLAGVLAISLADIVPPHVPKPMYHSPLPSCVALVAVLPAPILNRS